MASGTEFTHDFCAGIGPLQLGVVLVRLNVKITGLGNGRNGMKLKLSVPLFILAFLQNMSMLHKTSLEIYRCYDSIPLPDTMIGLHHILKEPKGLQVS